MVRRSPREEEQMRDFCIVARCAQSLDNVPLPSFVFTVERYCNLYGSLLTKNEKKQNQISNAYLTRFFGRPMREDFAVLNQADYDTFHTLSQIRQEKRQLLLSDFMIS